MKTESTTDEYSCGLALFRWRHHRLHAVTPVGWILSEPELQTPGEWRSDHKFFQAFDNVEDVVIAMFLDIEKNDDSHWVSRTTKVEGGYVIGIVKSADIERNRFGWRASEVEIVAFPGIDWVYQILYTARSGRGRFFSAKLKKGRLSVISDTSYHYPMRLYFDKAPRDSFFYFTGSPPDAIQKLFLDPTAMAALSKICGVPYYGGLKGRIASLWNRIRGNQEPEGTRKEWKSLVENSGITTKGGMSQASFLSRRLEIARLYQEIMDDQKDFIPEKNFRCLSRKSGDVRTQAALGFRAWNIHNSPYLTSLTGAGRNQTLEKGVQRAECIRCGDDCPGKNCHCGFNAFNTLQKFLSSEYNYDQNIIIGAVAGMGNLRIHEGHGWRAERMGVIALLCLLEEDQSNIYLYKEIAAFYEVPIFFDPVPFEEYALTQASLDHCRDTPEIGVDRVPEKSLW